MASVCVAESTVPREETRVRVFVGVHRTLFSLCSRLSRGRNWGPSWLCLERVGLVDAGDRYRHMYMHHLQPVYFFPIDSM